MSVFITARLRTWHPATQTQRTLKTARCAFSGNVPPLVAFAATMLPRLDPQFVRLAFGSGVTPPTLEVGFGADRKGTRWTVEFELLDEHLLPVFTRMMQANAKAVGVAIMPIDSDDDGGGQTLSVPTVSKSALAQMIAASAAVN